MAQALPMSPRAPYVAALLLMACASTEEGPSDAALPGDGGKLEMDVAPVPCATNDDCQRASGRPFCDPESGQCVQCRNPSDACPPGTFCDIARRACVPGCNNDMECEARPPADAGYWDGFAGGDAMVPAVPRTRCALASHACVECLGDTDCPPGLVCDTNACRPGCNRSHPCPTARSCCDGACVDTNSNARHCGACGTACPEGSTACCTGRCQNTATDPDHCGGCGMTCAVPRAVAGCSAAMCTVRSCLPGFADVDGMAANGCECETGMSAATCAAATEVAQIAAGDSRDVTGVLAGAATEHWYRVSFAMSRSNLHITLANNPGAAYRFDLRSTCAGAVMTCSDNTMGAAGIDDWTFYDTPGMHSARRTPWPSPTFVRVFRIASSMSCEPYVVRVSN